jgi:hypothetical protein
MQEFKEMDFNLQARRGPLWIGPARAGDWRLAPRRSRLPGDPKSIER